MSGRMMTLLRKKQLDYTFLANSGSEVVTLRRAIRVVPFYHYQLAVRVHNRSIVSGNFTFYVYQTLPSREDPQEFTDPTDIMSIQVVSGTTPPALLFDTASASYSPYFKFAVKCSQGTGGDRLYAEISAVLLARTP